MKNEPRPLTSDQLKKLQARSEKFAGENAKRIDQKRQNATPFGLYVLWAVAVVLLFIVPLAGVALAIFLLIFGSKMKSTIG